MVKKQAATENTSKIHERAVPNNLRQYVEKYGRNAAAHKLGRSPTYIGTWLAVNECSVEAELCCELLLKSERTPGKTAVAIITGSKDTLNAVKALVEASGTFQYIE